MGREGKRGNRQVERTKSHLKSALVELIAEKGYRHVTVTDLVQRACYNRTTFYHYYLDKRDITEELQGEMVAAIKRTSMERYVVGDRVDVNRMHAQSYELIYFIYRNRAYFDLLLLEDTIPHMHHDLPDALYELLHTHFQFDSSKDTINSDAHKRYMAHGTAGFITEWIKSGYAQKPEDISVQLIGILKTMVDGFVIKGETHENESLHFDDIAPARGRIINEGSSHMYK